MRVRSIAINLALLSCAALIGCATSRSEIKLSSTAAAEAPPAQATGKIAAIRIVKDERIFEQAPEEPSTPSLGFEGAAKATAETKLRAIGRKRNTFGQAIGDVLLQDGQTVEGVVRESLAAALRESGYQLAEPTNPPPAAMVIDVHIKTFWAWLNPGFWSITANTSIATDLDIADRAGALAISVHYQDSRQFVTDSTWIEVIDKALQAYRVEAAKKLSVPM
jgi:hypothetical protein